MKRFPKTVAACIKPLIAPALLKRGFYEARLVQEWVSVAGELAAEALPQKITFPRGQKTDGTLTLLTTASRALELQHMEPVILERIATFFGYRAISRIVYTHAPASTFLKEERPLNIRAAAKGEDGLAASLQRIGEALQH